MAVRPAERGDPTRDASAVAVVVVLMFMVPAATGTVGRMRKPIGACCGACGDWIVLVR